MTPTLVSIETAEEQDFITQLVFGQLNSKSNIWIGAQRVGNGTDFVWNDGRPLNYENWNVNKPSDDEEKRCVIIQSNSANKLNNSEAFSTGKWMDVSCETGNYIFCQKLQTWTFPHLQNSLLIEKKNSKTKYENLINQLNVAQEERNQLKEQLTDLSLKYENLKQEISRCITELKFGAAEDSQLWLGPGYGDVPGYVITGVYNHDQDDYADGVDRRAFFQKKFDGQWSLVPGD